jgi:hypothetical protein
MFNIRDEGEVVKQGFNFYPTKSNHIGFVLRIKDKFITARYSKVVKRFVVSL